MGLQNRNDRRGAEGNSGSTEQRWQRPLEQRLRSLLHHPSTSLFFQHQGLYQLFTICCILCIIVPFNFCTVCVDITTPPSETWAAPGTRG